MMKLQGLPASLSTDNRRGMKTIQNREEEIKSDYTVKHSWIKDTLYLSCAIVASRYQPSVMVWAPRQTGNLSCVPREGPVGLCDGYWRLRIAF